MKTYTYKCEYAEASDIIAKITANPEQYCFMPTSSGSIEIYDPVTKPKIYSGPTNNMNGVSIRDKEIGELLDAIKNPTAKK